MKDEENDDSQETARPSHWTMDGCPDDVYKSRYWQQTAQNAKQHKLVFYDPKNADVPLDSSHPTDLSGASKESCRKQPLPHGSSTSRVTNQINSLKKPSPPESQSARPLPLPQNENTISKEMEVPRKQAVQKDDALRSEDREQKTNDSKIPTPPDDLVKRLLSQSCNPLLIDLTKEELIHLVARLRQTQRLPDSKSGLPQPSGSAIIKPRQSMFERGDASIVKETKTITPNNEPAKRIFRNTFLVVWLLSGFALFHYADSFSTDCMIATLLSVFITPFLATLIHKSRSKQS